MLKPSATMFGAAALVYFCLNPDEELTLADMQDKFGDRMYKTQANCLIARYVQAGWIKKEVRMMPHRSGRGATATGVYSAGSKLLEALQRPGSSNHRGDFGRGHT